MSLSALTPLMPGLPTSAQPVEAQPPVPPVELPDEMSARDAVDEQGRATFTPPAEGMAAVGAALHRNRLGGLALGVREIARGEPVAPTESEPASAPARPAPSPAGIYPSVQSMAILQPLLTRLVGQWSEGVTVQFRLDTQDFRSAATTPKPAAPRVTVPTAGASPSAGARPTLDVSRFGGAAPLAAALAHTVAPALGRTIVAAALREQGVTALTFGGEPLQVEGGMRGLELRPAAGFWGGADESVAAMPWNPHAGREQFEAFAQQLQRRPSSAALAAASDPATPSEGAATAPGSANTTPAASTSAPASSVATPTGLPPPSASPDAQPMQVTLTIAALPMRLPQSESPDARRREPNGESDGGSGRAPLESPQSLGRLLRGKVDLGERGYLNFEIRSLHGRFSVLLGASEALSAQAQAQQARLEQALHALPGFTELHWGE